MIKKRRWLWVILFVSTAVLLTLLATGWNVVLMRDYQYLVSLSKKAAFPEINLPEAGLVLRMVLGTLGFSAALGLTVLIFVKLLNEMRLNQAQSEFLAAMSHELKSPIAAIELSSTLLRSGSSSESEARSLWDSHQTELKRLKEEVSALLEAAKWQSKVPKLKREYVWMETWIQQSWVRWKVALGSDALFSREGDPLETYAWVDTRSLQLILDNLISNSKKFSQGTPQVVIRTRKIFKRPHRFWRRRKSLWQIEVVDRGWGFDPRDSKRIFQRFVRAKSTAPYAIAGTGLGLYLAAASSRASGLRLSGESLGAGHGAVFRLEGTEYFL